MRVVQSIPAIPSLPFKNWCEEHDAVEDFWDNIPELISKRINQNG